MKSLTLEGNKILVEFSYDYGLVQEIRTIPGRQWNPLFKYWEVPYNNMSIQTLEEMGFNTSSLRHHINRQRAIIQTEMTEMTKKAKGLYPFLYNFQTEAVAKAILNKNLLIADEMGLGKTVTSFAVAHYQYNNGGINRIIVCCPQSIKWQWQNEIKKFFDLGSIIIEGTKEDRKDLYKALSKQDGITILIINYEQILRDFWELHELIDGQFLILDEASYIKNAKAQRTKLIKEFKPKYLLALTGTPIENRLQDAYTIGNIVHKGWMSKGELYNYLEYDNESRYPVLIGYKNTSQFMERLMEIAIRRKRDDVTQMPDKITEDRNVRMTDYQRELEKNLIEKIRMDIVDNKSNSGLHQFVLLPMLENSTELIKLSEAKSLRDIDRTAIKIESAKLVELKKLIEEVDDKKVVIFTRFKKMAKIIEREFEGAIIGSGDSDKQHILEVFQNNEKVRFLVATEAFAYGVDMPFASVVINFDIPWNPARLKQRIDRCYRLTSKHRLLVINLISDGLEEYIYNVMKGKEELADKVTNFHLKEQLLKFIER